MTEIRLTLDYKVGPIWTYSDDERQKLTSGSDIVDNDEIAQRLNDEIQNMESSYYEFNSHDMPLWINEEKALNEKEQMYDKVQQLVKRLEEINDGSYTIVDLLSFEIEESIRIRDRQRKKESESK